MDRCVPGEQIPVTLEDASGDRRVVYLTLIEMPTKENIDEYVPTRKGKVIMNIP
jgi:hypothetical protein